MTEKIHSVTGLWAWNKEEGLRGHLWVQPPSWIWMEAKPKKGVAMDRLFFFFLNLLLNLVVERKYMHRK